MLQRTRADQAERVWLAFVTNYPTLESAATAPASDILECLAPLGLRWRAVNIQAALVHLASLDWPSVTCDIGAVRGVGHYVASAVQIFAHGGRAPLVDNNVVRVYSRFFGIIAGDDTRRSPAFHALAYQMLPGETKRVRAFNWALLDLAGTVCTRSPKCGVCPVAARCVWASSNCVPARRTRQSDLTPREPTP